jgi:hypothetical protein
MSSAAELQEVERRQQEIGSRIAVVAKIVLADQPGFISVGAIVLAMAHLLPLYSKPDHEGTVLVTASDYLANYAGARFPVRRPGQ